jgi:hypothetical protein
MSLLAESLVEEWLNRNNFFTIRGIKHGVRELDLLGIHRELTGSISGWHVEVQVRFRPIGYIAKITRLWCCGLAKHLVFRKRKLLRPQRLPKLSGHAGRVSGWEPECPSSITEA